MEAPPLIAAVAVHFIGVRGLLVDLVQVQGSFARWAKLDTVRWRPSEAIVTPSGSSALRKNALLAS